MNTIGMTYNNKTHKYTKVGESWYEYLSEDEKLRILVAKRKREQEERRQYEFEHSKGYCPHCFTLRTLKGVCPNGCED